MPSSPLLQRLFAYRRWADRAFLDAIEALDPSVHADLRHAALRLMHHIHLVDRIFAAHLAGEPHGIGSTSPAETPPLGELRAATDACLAGYQRHIETATARTLAEEIPFVFTDGDAGCMSREEMLLHVLTHSGYHRGEIGRLLASAGAALPWDTLAVFLHASEPARRSVSAAAAPAPRRPSPPRPVPAPAR